MRTRHILLIPSLLLALGTGCGGEEDSGPGSNVSSSEANVVQQASSNAVGALMQDMMLPDLQSLAAGQAAGAWIQGALDNFNLDGVFDNAAGGTIDFSGTGALAGTGFVDLGFKANLKDWLDSESGLTLDGALDITTTVKSFLPPEVNVGIKGTLDVSGAVQAKVPIDLSMDLLQDGALTCGTVSALDVNLDQCGDIITSQLASAAQLSILATAQQLQAEVLAQSTTLGLPGLGGDTVKITGSINGPAGGSLDYSGSVTVGMTGDVEADITLTFKNWLDSAGVPLDGTLQVTQDVTAAVVKSAIKGSLSVNGVASTAVDLQITVDSSDPNGASVCGTIAGHTIAIGTCNP